MARGRDDGDMVMALTGGGISQSAIIERQAETIARLERHAEKANEYKTITKVRLKEAAQRLREYRLRVEALQSELATARDDVTRLQRALDAEKAKPRAPPPPPPKRPTRDVGSQTTMTRSTSVGVQTAPEPRALLVAVGTQTIEEEEHAKEKADAEAMETREAPSKAPSLMDEINAEIEAALASSSSEEEEEDDEKKKKKDTTVDHDAIARAIDAELGLDSSDDDDDDDSSSSSSSESDREVVTAKEQSQPPATEDVISAAIDAELASSSDDDMDAEDPLAMLHSAAPSMALSMPAGLLEPPVGVVSEAPKTSTEAETETEDAVTVVTRELMDSVSAAIDAELELSDEEDAKADDEPQPATVTTEPETSVTVERIRTFSLSSLDSDSDSDGSDGSDGSDDSDPQPIDADGAFAGEATESVETLENLRSQEHRSVESFDGRGKQVAASSEEQQQQQQQIKTTSAGAEVSPPEPTPVGEGTTEQPVASPRTTTEASTAPDAVHAPDATNPTTASTAVPSPSRPLVTCSAATADTTSIQHESASDTSRPQASIQEDSDLTTSSSDLQSKTEASTASTKRPIDASTSTEDGEIAVQPSPKRQRVDGPTASAAAAAVPTQPSTSAPKSSSSSSSSSTLSLPPQAIVAYKQAIALQDREKPDARFVARALGELLRRSTVDHVLVLERSERLTRLLCDEFRRRGVAAAAVMDGVLRVVHAPRTRRTGGRDIGAVARLFRDVLLGASASQSATDLDAAVHQWTQTLQELIVPRRFLVPGISFFQADETQDSQTPALAATEAALKLYAVVLKRAQGATPPVSSDKAILTYLCALHGELCRARDAVAAVRVLALDVLKAYPSIKGLVLVRQLVESWPSVLNVDARTDDASTTAVSTSTLRQAMLEALVVLTQRSMQRQELYLEQSAIAMLSSIADALDLPTLLVGCDEDDGGAASAARLWSQVHALAAATQSPETSSPFAVDELAMALELSALVRGPEWVERHWALSMLTKLQCGQPSTAAVVVRFVGSIARGLMQAPRGHQDGSNGDGLVAESIEWMLLRLEAASVDAEDEDVAVVATELVEVLLALSSTWLQSTPPSAAWLALQTQRPAWLGRLLRWMSRKRLETHLSPRALRRLRLVVLSARPLGGGTVSITV